MYRFLQRKFPLKKNIAEQARDMDAAEVFTADITGIDSYPKAGNYFKFNTKYINK